VGKPALIALGSNLGDRATTLDRAVAALRATAGITVTAVSTWHATAPVGGPVQGEFLNGAAALRTSLSPDELLAAMTYIEEEFGRQREVHWGPRTLDLDLILYGAVVQQGDALSVPHPRFRERAFVLLPAAEIAGDWIDPVTGQTVAELAGALATSREG
jgi:2-amino-4-hydroxy-6-hydroxymethyldihydropteridine diphosphokinase